MHQRWEQDMGLRDPQEPKGMGTELDGGVEKRMDKKF